MKSFIRENWKFLLFVLVCGLIGGYCTGLYLPDTYSPEMLRQMEAQNMTAGALALSAAIQYGVVYGLVLAAVGVVFSEKVRLWRAFRFDRGAAIATAVVSVVAALLLFPGDKWIFGRFSGWVSDQYTRAPGLPKILSGLLVGGVIEEVMMRLFFMSLLAFLISKLFCRGAKEIPAAAFVAANIVAALLFAAGHLPGTMAMTTLTPVLIVRCFLLNGGFGLCFGWLYRRYGIGYAMIAHGLAHLISDLMMIAFIR